MQQTEYTSLNGVDVAKARFPLYVTRKRQVTQHKTKLDLVLCCVTCV